MRIETYKCKPKDNCMAIGIWFQHDEDTDKSINIHFIFGSFTIAYRKIESFINIDFQIPYVYAYQITIYL